MFEPKVKNNQTVKGILPLTQRDKDKSNKLTNQHNKSKVNKMKILINKTTKNNKPLFLGLFSRKKGIDNKEVEGT